MLKSIIHSLYLNRFLKKLENKLSDRAINFGYSIFKIYHINCGFILSTFLISILSIFGCANKTKINELLPNRNYTENIIFVTSTKDESIKFETTLFEPNNNDQNSTSPIVVIVHGTNPKGIQKRERSIHATEFFLKQGWTVVLPMRRGYSQSSGQKISLKNCDLKNYGLENALDIAEVINWLTANEKYKNRKIILIGQSTGGLTVMAYSSLPNNKVNAVINFHGGMRPIDENDCKWQARIDAFNDYAKTSKPLSLWIYTANDHSSNPEYINRLYGEFLKSGGKVRLAQFGPFKDDGHYIFGSLDGGEIWQPKVLDYLRKQQIYSDK